MSMTWVLVIGFIAMFLLIMFIHQPEKWKRKVNKKMEQKIKERLAEEEMVLKMENQKS